MIRGIATQAERLLTKTVSSINNAICITGVHCCNDKVGDDFLKSMHCEKT
jgi:hypothetical protein